MSAAGMTNAEALRILDVPRSSRVEIVEPQSVTPRHLNWKISVYTHRLARQHGVLCVTGWSAQKNCPGLAIS
jgi:hypothetical protein